MSVLDENLANCLKEIGYEQISPLRFKKDNLTVNYEHAAAHEKEATIRAIQTHCTCKLASVLTKSFNPFKWFT